MGWGPRCEPWLLPSDLQRGGRAKHWQHPDRQRTPRVNDQSESYSQLARASKSDVRRRHRAALGMSRKAWSRSKRRRKARRQRSTSTGVAAVVEHHSPVSDRGRLAGARPSGKSMCRGGWVVRRGSARGRRVISRGTAIGRAGPVTSAECAANRRAAPGRPRESRSLRSRVNAGVPQSFPQAVQDRCRTLPWQRKGFPDVAHATSVSGNPLTPGPRRTSWSKPSPRTSHHPPSGPSTGRRP